MTDVVDHYRDLLEQAFGGRRWILAMDVLAPMRGISAQLQRFGAEGCLCIAGSRGAGDSPDPDFAPDPIVLGVRGEDMMSAIRASLDALATLSPEVCARVDAFDPNHEVRVIGTIFDDGRPVAGRDKYGARPSSWQALEDKTRVDALWDRVGVERYPSRIVSVDDRGGLREAARALDAGAGTVWTADSREGFHGGASFTRWVDGEASNAMRDFFAAHADRVRIMPFMEGIPCSIHGIVFPEQTIALRPCEMLVFRKPGTGAFHYGKCATFWDPPDADREQMRAIARRVGDRLRSDVGYRGAFTIDGVMTADGFRPTELNPRYGAALGVMTSTVDLPMMLVNLMVVEGEPFDWRSAEVEETILRVADAHRAGATSAIVGVRVDDEVHETLAWDGRGYRRASEEDADARLLLGPSASGSYLSIRFAPQSVPVGASVAPRAAAALRWADEAFDLGIGELVPAREVRR